MKKLMVAVSMVLAMGLVANVALSDETIPFPFWQHGSGIYCFWSISNTNDTDTVTVTIELLRGNGDAFLSTTSTVDPETAWQPGSYETWFSEESGGASGFGWGRYHVNNGGFDDLAHDCVTLWGAVLGFAADGTQPGYTIILPGNPYGSPSY